MHDGGTIDIAELGNNVGEPVEITSLTFQADPQDPNSSELTISLDSVPSNLEFGESQMVTASVTCTGLSLGESTGPVNAVLSVTAEGASTSVTLERTVTVECRNCVPCDSGTDELVKYEWVGSDDNDDSDSDGGDDEDAGDDEDGGDDEDDSDDENSGFTTEGSDSNIELTGKTLDDEGEPVEACFSIDYCNVDVVVKAATNYETYENQTRTVCVTDIDGHAISYIRFFCDAPDDVTVGNGTGGGGDDDEDDDGDDGDSDDGNEGGPPEDPGNGKGTGGGGPSGDDEDSDD
jgi:hypothetical protein